MANPEHLEILNKGVEVWNEWRKGAPVEVDLYEARLFKRDLRGVNLAGAQLSRADLYDTDLRGADLRRARLRRAKLEKAKLNRADLREADFRKADFREADLSYANLAGANLEQAQLVVANLEGAVLTDCLIYGVSAWGVKLEGAEQTNLIIARPDASTITVDNLEVAQFIDLLLNNKKIRKVIDTITSKVVLILGRFTPERKPVLDGLRDELLRYDYTPVLFDFEKPASRDYIETVSTLAHMASFVVADITDPKVVLEEVPHVVRNIAVPVQPLMLKGAGDEPVTLYNLRRNHRSLLDTYHYMDLQDLLGALSDKVIAPAEAKAKELRVG